MADFQVYQCCYTNAVHEVGGKIRESGWSNVNVSRDLPGFAMQRCQKIQQFNAGIQGGMQNEQGEMITSYDEILGDGPYIYVLRARYGLVDLRGRANLFSHAYIFQADAACPAAQDGGDFPFLRIQPDCFRESEQDSRLPDSGVLDASKLTYAPMTLDDAMRTAGLRNREDYVSLILCVYVQMTAQMPPEHRKLYALKAGVNLKGPLYIQCAGDEQRRALLYCVYSGLPWYLRFTLKSAVYTAAATGTAGMEFNLIFTTDAKAQNGIYFLPAADGQPCENNLIDNPAILDKRAKDNLRTQYIGYAASMEGGNLAGRLSAFYRGLHEAAERLGDSSGSNEWALELVKDFYWKEPLEPGGLLPMPDTGKMDNVPALKKLLFMASQCGLYSGEMIRLVQDTEKALRKANETEYLGKFKVFLDQIHEAAGNIRPESDGSLGPVKPKNPGQDGDLSPYQDALREEAEYLLKLVKEGTPHLAVGKMRDAYRNNSDYFRDVLQTLGQSNEGASLAVQICYNVCKSDISSLNELEKFRELVCVLPENCRQYHQVYEKAMELYKKEIQPREKPTIVLSKFQQIVNQVQGTEAARARAMDDARKIYWEGFDWTDVQVGKLKEYREFLPEDGGNKFTGLLELAEAYIPGNEASYLDDVFRYFGYEGGYGAKMTAPNERERIIHILSQKLLPGRVDRAAIPINLPDWMKLVSWEYGTPEYLNVIKTIYVASCGEDAPAMMEAYLNFLRLNDTRERKYSTDIKEFISNTLWSFCVKLEAHKVPVPVDLWLLVASNKPTSANGYSNAFMVFADFPNAAILKMPPERVAYHSRLLKIRAVQREADEFCTQKGDRKLQSKVKAWVEASKAMERKTPVQTSQRSFHVDPAAARPGGPVMTHKPG